MGTKAETDLPGRPGDEERRNENIVTNPGLGCVVAKIVFLLLAVTPWKKRKRQHDVEMNCIPNRVEVRNAKSSHIAWWDKRAPPLRE
jgi:hypothetical protein